MKARTAAVSVSLACFSATLGATGLGCASRSTTIDDADARRMVELLMPQRIEIVEAFTAFDSFDEDEIPDGVTLRLQAQDTYGDPVKIAGDILIELYSFVPASADRKGARLCEPWRLSLIEPRDQQTYWNMVTGMYEIPLKFPLESDLDLATHAGRKFVLAVTYNTPLEGHMSDECTIQAPSNLR